MSETDLERFPLPLNDSKKIGLVSFDARVNAGWQRPCLWCLLPSLLAPECLRGAWTTAVRSGRLFHIGGLTLLFAIDLASECLPERGVLPKSLLMLPRASNDMDPEAPTAGVGIGPHVLHPLSKGRRSELKQQILRIEVTI